VPVTPAAPRGGGEAPELAGPAGYRGGPASWPWQETAAGALRRHVIMPADTAAQLDDRIEEDPLPPAALPGSGRGQRAHGGDRRHDRVADQLSTTTEPPGVVAGPPAAGHPRGYVPAVHLIAPPTGDRTYRPGSSLRARRPKGNRRSGELLRPTHTTSATRAHRVSTISRVATRNACPQRSIWLGGYGWRFGRG